MNDPTVADLFESLGFGRPGTSIDAAVAWALVEVHLRRQRLTVGDTVRVSGFADAESEEAHGDLLGKTGVIVEIRGDGMGMGETVEDPVYIVRVYLSEYSSGRSYIKASFFREEIEPA